ncbi:MAG: rhomboid family intramembrane serine protease [Candidatus Zixiibacteriota bacterium]|nr:MAG: rhomboid family intramembrane serine protease [candidate division Zixibacteria bacterium]
MFFPIRDDIPTIRKPYLTVALIAINSIIFLYSQLLGGRGFNLFIIQYGYIPYELVHSIELTPEIPSSVFYTVFSSMFMHGGWIHLIGNMLFLWIYGNNVEDYFGRVKFIIFYLVSGLAAIGLYTLFGPNSQIPLVGASGAIAGLMGAYIVLHPRAKITCLVVFFFIQFMTLPAKVVLGFWFGYQLLMSLVGSSTGGGVAYLAHVGGFAFGWGLLKLLTRGGRRGGSATDGQRAYRIRWR